MMSPFTDIFTLPGHHRSQCAYFGRIQQSRRTSNSRPARTAVTMGLQSAAPNGSPDMALQPTALATLSFPKPSESLKSLTPKAVPNPSPSQLKRDQDVVAEPFPER